MMTPATATTFQRESTTSIEILKSVLKCSCSPYKDVYTFNRWKAQNMSVNKGEHGIRLPLIKVVDEKDDKGETIHTRKVLGHSFVFCRCQVHEMGTRHPMPEPEPIVRPEPQPVAKPEPAKPEYRHEPKITSRVDDIMKGWTTI